MLATMSEHADTLVSLQIQVRKRTRARLKAEAAELEMDMSSLGQAILDHALGLIADGKTPPALLKIISEYKKSREAEE